MLFGKLTEYWPKIIVVGFFSDHGWVLPYKEEKTLQLQIYPPSSSLDHRLTTASYTSIKRLAHKQAFHMFLDWSVSPPIFFKAQIIMISWHVLTCSLGGGALRSKHWWHKPSKLDRPLTHIARFKSIKGCAVPHVQVLCFVYHWRSRLSEQETNMERRCFSLCFYNYADHLSDMQDKGRAQEQVLTQE